MTSRPLRGGCHCGRNAYIISAPEGTNDVAQVLFDNEPSHRISLASPLAAFIRVPLSWYHATTISYFPDETSSQIHRVYTHPREQRSKRHFCGFCGTPLSFWSEDPHTEAEYIHLTLGSLCAEDLNDLEELGMLPDAERDGDSDADAEREEQEAALEQNAGAPAEQPPADPSTDAGGSVGVALAGRETMGPSWFDSMVAGSRLGELRMSRGSRESKDGRIKLRWEVVEWTENSSGENSPNPAKRKLGDRADVDQEMMQE